jgi:putative ABC transport system permease protein
LRERSERAVNLLSRWRKTTMLKNYFITAINNLIKNKLYSAINIIGLAIGLSACLVIALYVWDQYSYDTQWKDYDRIYRVNFSFTLPGRPLAEMAISPFPAMQTLKEYFKDNIEKSTRTFAGNLTIDIGDDKFKSRVARVDHDFIDIFQLDVIAGSLEETLSSMTNIALSEETARRHFGRQDPIGKVITISVDNIKVDQKVTAVYRIPGNTVLDDIPMIGLLDDTVFPPSYKSWYNLPCRTYVKLKAGVDIETMKPLLPALIDRNIDISNIISDPNLKASDVISINFQRLDTAHLDSPFDVDRAGGNKTVVMAFAGISLLVLLIGCINFTILTTAKATQRAREVAMRKVVGAKRKQLVAQFLGESTFIVLLSMILSLGVVEIMLPIFASIVGKNFSLNYTSPSTFLPLLALLIIVGISGGLYPAFILSGFRPGDTLKANQSKETRGSMSLRNVLVIFQFCVSIILIVSTGVIYAQTQYSMNRDPGYNKDNLLVINQLARNDNIKGKIEVLKQELLSLADVSSVGLSFIQPSQQQGGNLVYTKQGHPETTYIKSTTGSGYDYFKTYQIPIVAGRDFSIDRDIPDPKFDNTTTIGGNESKELLHRSVIINETAAREFGFASPEEAIGNVLNSTTTNNMSYTIIGVVADNHIFSIKAMPRAEVYRLQPDDNSVMTIRFKGSPKKILKEVNNTWERVVGKEEISTVFVDQLIAQEFQQEKTEQNIIISFSILAILIACMGLFGSTSFTVEKRTKEIGLRKVMGAKVKNIVTLLLWQFSKPVLIANIIAWPVAIYAMQNWLERFPYRFNPLFMIPICLVSGLIALVIAWFTVAGNTTRVAKSKPIKALRYE